jgi:hypothetical protein
VNLLTDPAKRSFLNVRLDEEKKRKEKTAGMEKRKRTMVEVSKPSKKSSLQVEQQLITNRYALRPFDRPFKLEKKKLNEPN